FGSSTGSSTGSSGSGFAGGFGSSTGSSSGTQGFGGTAGSTSRAGQSQFGMTGPFGRFMGNPMSSGQISGNTSSTLLPAFPLPLPSAAPATTVGTRGPGPATLGGAPGGFSGAAGGLSGLTGTATVTTTAALIGGSSAGIRRAPSYFTALAPEIRTVERTATSL